jgi:hypothetical protein
MRRLEGADLAAQIADRGFRIGIAQPQKMFERLVDRAQLAHQRRKPAIGQRHQAVRRRRLMGRGDNAILLHGRVLDAAVLIHAAIACSKSVLS